jgi:putative RecB family exonuclease
MFRFRTIDRLPEPPSKAATKGTLVHWVLEHLYNAPIGRRSPEAAHALVPNALTAVQARTPDLDTMFESEADKKQWLAEAGKLIDRYFTLEDPNRLEPAEREVNISALLDGTMRIKGIIDRVDIAPNGAVRLVDYKTGKAPRPQYSASAAFQMRFYAVAMREARGVTPAMLQLNYLGDGQVLRNEPTEADLDQAKGKIISIWDDIRRNAERDEWRPRTSKLCGWCSFQSICPSFGGAPPELEQGASAKVWLEPPTLFDRSMSEIAHDPAS